MNFNSNKIWDPFQVAKKAEAPRSIQTPEGIGDRLRLIAFAEKQAEVAFLWAIQNYSEASSALKNLWAELAREEASHLQLLINRMQELGARPEDRKVSDALWRSLVQCPDQDSFCYFMKRSETRGQEAGERLQVLLQELDPITGNLLFQISEDEKRHVESTEKYFRKN